MAAVASIKYIIYLVYPTGRNAQACNGFWGKEERTMTNVIYVQVFSFGDAYAGAAVEAQAIDSTGAPLAPFSTAKVVASGAGQFFCPFTLPDGFRGVLCGRLVATPLVIDVQQVNLVAAAQSAVVIGDAMPVLSVVIR